jgi:hypothetical protein
MDRIAVAALVLGGCVEYEVSKDVDPGSLPEGEATGEAGTTPDDLPGTTVPTGPTSTTTDTGGGPGLRYGHFDVDTASYIAPWSTGNTDAHVHEYDNRHNVVYIDCMDPLSEELHGMPEDIPADQPFVLIVGNPDLSPGGWLTFPTGSVRVTDQAATPIDQLTTWSLSGAAGTTRLDSLALTFDRNAIPDGGLIGTETECVRSNEPGVGGTWRNGALTVQAVDPATVATDLSSSAGGVHGVATAGLLWEMTVFWHWNGPCSHDPDWASWVPDLEP